LTPTEAPKTDHTVEFPDDDPWQTIDSCQTIRRKLNACSAVNVAADAVDDEAETAPKPLENDRLRLIAASSSDTCNRNRWAAMLSDVFPALISTVLRAEETVRRRLAILRAERPELYTRSAVNVAAGDEAETAPKPLENDRVRLVAASNSVRHQGDGEVARKDRVARGNDPGRPRQVSGLRRGGQPSSDPKVHIKDTKHFVVLPANQDPVDFVLRRRGRRVTESQHALFARLATMRPASAPSPAVIAPTANDGVMHLLPEVICGAKPENPSTSA
jgi:hypothetical protein